MLGKLKIRLMVLAVTVNGMGALALFSAPLNAALDACPTVVGCFYDHFYPPPCPAYVFLNDYCWTYYPPPGAGCGMAQPFCASYQLEECTDYGGVTIVCPYLCP